MECPYCEDEEIRKRIIADNGLAFDFPTNIPIVPGHTLVSPVRCMRYYEDLSLEEKIAFEDMRFKIKLALKRAYGAQGFNYAWNEGGRTIRSPSPPAYSSAQGRRHWGASVRTAPIPLSATGAHRTNTT
ncbi:MAG: hypothetical protein KatS3mg099_275 [Candidatus Parcubacteria bacterium]|nr:MAG: hypothetical protein KatS3mg099_275 [Candidatus Parcubacteria bacterium]GIW68693.1 MAG: hypothetical protein KatS3mg100_187 [Candidatus Parcubacteria bacterium]